MEDGSGIAPSTSCWPCRTGSALPPVLAARGFGPRSSAGDTHTPKAEHGELSWDMKGIREEIEVFYGVGFCLASRQKNPTARTEMWGCAGISFLETKAAVIFCHPA